MSEIWDLVDKDKNKIGTTYERNCGTPIPKGMYHLAVEIWTIKPNGGILLTQRHQNKNYGLMWEATGGAVLSGESSIQGAVRELYEETGIKVNENELTYIGDIVGDTYIMDEYVHILESEDIELNLQPEEVVDAMWVSKEELENKKDLIVGSVWERYCKYKDQIIGR